MTDHDPICTRFRRAVDEPFQPCICGELREARADEQDKCDRLFRATRDRDLRAKVEALLAYDMKSVGLTQLVKRADVLALIDGSSDE